MKKLLLSLLLLTNNLFGQTPCEDGFAGSYDCLGVDLQSHISAIDLGSEEHNGIWVNDLWGWVDPETDREYALVGMPNGTSFVDITDPINPVVLGVLKEHNFDQTSASYQAMHDGAKSSWRDIKVYANHAYIVSEDPNHGMQVFDLTDLRDVADTPAEFTEAGHYAGIGKAHNLAINEETGFAYAVGFNANDERACSVGGLHIIDLSDPRNPVFAGCFDDDGYTHDAQCVIYVGPDEDYQGMEICFNSNEEDVVIVDVSDKSNITIISKNGYDGAQYVHQGWLTEDHRYFLSNDELDEVYLGQNTRTFIWNVEDLDEPVFLGYYEHDNQAIDHNLYTSGKYVFESNYTNGLRILDTTGISYGILKEVAHFDTYVSNDATMFDGSWSNYPYFPSGNIVVSDISNGLFVLKMQSIFIEEQPQDVIACIGTHLDIPITAVGENITYQWQIDDGSGFKNIDNFERYKNTKTNAMHAHTLELSQNENQFRCVITNGITEIISDPMTLHVLDSPKAAFTYSFSGFSGEVTFSNESENTETYAWSFGDGGESDLETPTYEYLEEGIYEIILVATNGCTSDTTIQSLELVILSAEDDVSDFKIYPTVVSENLTIASKKAGTYELEIYSLQGNRLLKRKVKKGTSDLSLAGFQEGVYILKIHSGAGTLTRKIVVSR